MSLCGIIIEESLSDPSVLDKIQILSTEIEEVTENHKTPWLTKWTMHSVAIPEENIDSLAKELNHIIDRAESWYADFKNEKVHYIVFKNKVFAIDRTKKEQYDEATAYGISLGIPAHQVDFSPHLKDWKR